MRLLAEFGTGELLWSMLWFTVFFIWIWPLVTVFADIFRSADIGGASTALWCIFVIALPFLGVFVYLIARGNNMQDHSAAQMQAQQSAQEGYIRRALDAQQGGSAAQELARLADLRDRGTISESEFQTLRATTIA
jgi:hypothetical protein